MWSKKLPRNSNFSPGNSGFFQLLLLPKIVTLNEILPDYWCPATCQNWDLDHSEISLCSWMEKRLSPDIYCLEDEYHSATSGLTSACPPCSPVPEDFPPSAVLKRKELFSNPLVHPLICKRTVLPRQMLCPHFHGLLQTFSLFWITVKSEGCWKSGLQGFWASWAKTRLSFVHNCSQMTFGADLTLLILSDKGIWNEV